MTSRRIDFHTHIISSSLPDIATRYGGSGWPRVQNLCSCGADITIDGRVARRIEPNCWNPEERLVQMQAESITAQVLSPVPMTLCYRGPIEGSKYLARFQNSFLAETISRFPERFYGLGTVPMQEPEAAIAEMIHAVQELGLHGLEIGSSINGLTLGNPRFFPFMEAAAELRVPLFVHPVAALENEQLSKFGFSYTLGMPLDTAIAAASLIMEGVLDRLPSLKICLAHGGGALSFLLPRLDHGWASLTTPSHNEAAPSSYTDRFYVDSLVYSAKNLSYLVQSFGVNRVLLGTDYPFLLRENPPGSIVDESGFLNFRDKEDILANNCLRFLGIEGA